MFTVHDRAFAPLSGRFHEMAGRVEIAHRIAERHATRALHQSLVSDLRDQGHNPESLKLFNRHGSTSIGIEHGPVGDELFDTEFGTSTQLPQAPIRKAAKRRQVETAAHYNNILRDVIGL